MTRLLYYDFNSSHSQRVSDAKGRAPKWIRFGPIWPSEEERDEKVSSAAAVAAADDRRQASSQTKLRSDRQHWAPPLALASPFVCVCIVRASDRVNYGVGCISRAPIRTSSAPKCLSVCPPTTSAEAPDSGAKVSPVASQTRAKNVASLSRGARRRCRRRRRRRRRPPPSAGERAKD